MDGWYCVVLLHRISPDLFAVSQFAHGYSDSRAWIEKDRMVSLKSSDLYYDSNDSMHYFLDLMKCHIKYQISMHALKNGIKNALTRSGLARRPSPRIFSLHRN